MTQKAPGRKFSKKISTKSAKKPSRAKTAPAARELVLAYDLGGTKIAVGVVDRSGKVIEEMRQPVVLENGKAAVLKQLADLGLELLDRYPQIKRVGIASAGPLDPFKGLLLDPTNFASSAGTWGKVAIASILSKKLKRPVLLENDAAAAMLAEHWIGRARGYPNAMILTLGTGLGTGIIANNELVRAGHHFHPEAGHIILRAGDESAPCGCGNRGCAEAYLSGRNFGRRAAARFGDRNISAKDIAALARNRDPRALAAFDEYATMMSIAIHNFVVLYCPEVMVLTGSFAEAADLFIGATRERVEHLLERRRVGVDLVPKILVSSLDNQAGIVGAAWVAFNRPFKQLDKG